MSHLFDVFSQSIFIGFYLLLVIVAALYDTKVDSQTTKKSNDLNFKYLLWFSPLRNARKVLHVGNDGTEDPNQAQLNCLHGLRAITMFFVIVGHTLAWNNVNMFRGTFVMRDRIADWWPQFLFRFQMSVDTFFFMR